MPTKRAEPDHNTPPKSGEKKSKQSLCTICDELIDDGDENDVEAIYCEGSCQGWLHRRCAGLSKKLFHLMGESDDPFYCPHCKLLRQDKEIAELKNLVHSFKSLVDEIPILKSKIELQDSQLPNQSDTNQSTKPTFPTETSDSDMLHQSATAKLIQISKLAIQPHLLSHRHCCPIENLMPSSTV